MKKLLIFLSVLLTVVGCDMGNMNNTPTKQVEMLLARYQTLDQKVLDDLDDVVKEEVTFNTEQRERYRELMKKHYQGITYDVKEESMNGDEATVVVDIEVTDYSKVRKNAARYLEEHQEKFQDEDGEYSEEKFVDYELEQMEKTKDKVHYTMEFSLTKEKDKWKVDQLTEEELDKIHGIYNYS